MSKLSLEEWENLVGLPITNPQEFLDGCRDCDEGNMERDGMGQDYHRGYAAQYQANQLKSEGWA